ncbi:MAG: GerMN domain-containing protein [bacterium]|jgi:spore germination protein GerM|nr:GerMN domain-containing protein [bacterium]
MDLRNSLILFLLVLFLCSAGVAGFLYFQIQTTPSPIPVPDRLLQQPQPQIPTPVPQVAVDEPIQIEAPLFFLDAGQSQLIVETRWIEPAGVITDRVRKAIEVLIEGPFNRDLVPVIPADTTVQSVFWDENEKRIYISFSESLIQNHPGHALVEWATIYGIVNTVAAQAPHLIQEVQILINGEAVSGGQLVWDWSLPFPKDEMFVQYNVKN